MKPKQLSTKEIPDIKGFLIPYKDDARPVTVNVIGSDKTYLPIFSTKETFDSGMSEIPFVKIKQIEDASEFLFEAVPEMLTVIIDLRKTPEGKVRYTEIFQLKD